MQSMSRQARHLLLERCGTHALGNGSERLQPVLEVRRLLDSLQPGECKVEHPWCWGVLLGKLGGRVEVCVLKHTRAHLCQCMCQWLIYVGEAGIDEQRCNSWKAVLLRECGHPASMRSIRCASLHMAYMFNATCCCIDVLLGDRNRRARSMGDKCSSTCRHHDVRATRAVAGRTRTVYAAISFSRDAPWCSALASPCSSSRRMLCLGMFTVNCGYGFVTVGGIPILYIHKHTSKFNSGAVRFYNHWRLGRLL